MRNVALDCITHFVFYYSIDQSNIDYRISNLLLSDKHFHFTIKWLIVNDFSNY